MVAKFSDTLLATLSDWVARELYGARDVFRPNRHGPMKCSVCRAPCFGLHVEVAGSGEDEQVLRERPIHMRCFNRQGVRRVRQAKSRHDRRRLGLPRPPPAGYVIEDMRDAAEELERAGDYAEADAVRARARRLQALRQTGSS